MDHTGKTKILIVDQDTALTEKLAGRLSCIGFSTMLSSNRTKAYELVKSEKPDVIILDIYMDNRNGLGLLKDIRSNSVSAAIPVIIALPRDASSSVMFSLLSDASDYVAKPYDFKEVYTRLKAQLRALNMQKDLEKRNMELVEKNRLLEQMAITDSLTGIYNRRYALSRLVNEMSHSSRYKEPIAFIMIDIDYFKKINDQYGHLTGDLVLRGLAAHIKDSVRDVDIPSRYGGEEFLVICPNTDVHGAKILAERIRANVEKARFYNDDIEMHVTVSLGVRSYIPKVIYSTEEEINQAIGQADTALYIAKANGRNRVETYTASPEDSSTGYGKTSIGHTFPDEDLTAQKPVH